MGESSAKQREAISVVEHTQGVRIIRLEHSRGSGPYWFVEKSTPRGWRKSSGPHGSLASAQRGLAVAILTYVPPAPASRRKARP